MAEYLEREAAISWFMPYVHIGGYISADDMVEDIRNLPAADVAPVVRGRWDLLDDASSKIVKWNCDKCNRISTRKTDYCPNCGADMREGVSG